MKPSLEVTSSSSFCSLSHFLSYLSISSALPFCSKTRLQKQHFVSQGSGEFIIVITKNLNLQTIRIAYYWSNTTATVYFTTRFTATLIQGQTLIMGGIYWTQHEWVKSLAEMNALKKIQFNVRDDTWCCNMGLIYKPLLCYKQYIYFHSISTLPVTSQVTYPPCLKKCQTSLGTHDAICYPLFMLKSKWS